MSSVSKEREERLDCASELFNHNTTELGWPIQSFVWPSSFDGNIEYVAATGTSCFPCCLISDGLKHHAVTQQSEIDMNKSLANSPMSHYYRNGLSVPISAYNTRPSGKFCIPAT